jgi:ABC-type transport system involved in multi-copper enzyme maturation permease subunit
MTAASATIAARMTSADFLKMRKRKVTLIWAFLLALLPLVLYFVVAAAQHSSNPANAPAGGFKGFQDTLRLVALFFGPLAAILVGTDAGAGDFSAGVFRDLVVTGRSRLALFATRVPAALALTWLIVLVGYALGVIGTFLFAAGTPTPSASTIANGLGFTLLSTGVICVVAVGLASLTTSRPGTLVALIGWQLIASPILTNISSLGSSRKLVLREAIAHFSPVNLDNGGGHGPARGGAVTMGSATAVIVMTGWLIVFLALGAWRTRTMDA